MRTNSSSSSLNNMIWAVENMMLDTEPGVLFEEHKENIAELIEKTWERGDGLREIITELDPNIITEALGYFGVSMSDVSNDVNTVMSLCVTALKNIITTKTFDDLVALAMPISAYNPQLTSMTNQNSMTFEDYHLCLLNDILDSMSYELKGIHSNNGRPTGKTASQTKAFVAKLITAANNELNMLPQSEDKTLYESVIEYVDNNYEGGDLAGLSAIGVYIDTNIEKLILDRRAWAI